MSIGRLAGLRHHVRSLYSVGLQSFLHLATDMLIEIFAVFSIVLANVVCYACHEKSLLRVRVKGPTLLFISNRSRWSVGRSLKGYWALDAIDPAHLVESFFLNDVCLLLLRALSLAYFAVTLLLEGLTGDGFGNILGWFTFFTNWTFLLFGVWSLLGTILTGWSVQAKLRPASTARASQPRGSGEAESLTGATLNSDSGPTASSFKIKWGPLSTAYLFITETLATSTLFLSFFYWTFLFSPKYPLQIDNLLKHGVNNVILLFEVLFSRIPFVSYHFQVALAYGTFYTLFMWVYHAASLRWVYYVLDWKQPTALALYVLNPFFLFGAFAFWYIIACCREWLGSKLRPSQPMTSLQHVDFQ